MKKRLLSMLLILCLVTTLLSGFTVTASADNDTIQHTLKGGETVIGVCNSLGIDFYKNYKWITETNKITNYGNLKPGMVLTLPKPGTTPGLPATNPGGAATPGGNVTPGGGTAVLPGGGLKLLGNDFVSGYLITHIMQRGETISGVCAALGIDFASNSSTIQRINNIKDYGRIFAGRAILLPSPSAPSSGPCIAVVGHRVVKGDAMYNICNSYGIDFASNLSRIQSMNGRNDNFSRIQVGQVIYLPVPFVATPAGGGNNPGGNVTPGGNVKPVDPSKPDSGNDGGNVKPDQPAKPEDLGGGSIMPTGETYSISARNTNQFRGSYSVTVGGKEVKEAKSGSIVKLEASPKRDYQLGNISITDKEGNAVAVVKNDQFVMPNCDIIIRVDFVSKTEYSITKSASTNGQFSVKANGSEVSQAAADMLVTITPDPDFGFEPGQIVVKTSGGKTISVKADGSFKMPKDSITVSVSFNPAKPHDINKRIPLFAAGRGDFAFKVNGKVVKAAECGSVVQVITTPADGYRVDEITVTKADGNELEVTGSKFIMPETEVTVKVKFTAKTPEVTVVAYGAGDAAIQVDGVNVKNVISGKTVKVDAEPKPIKEGGSASVYEYYHAEVINQVTGLEVPFDFAKSSFVMPNDDVEVHVYFRLKELPVHGVRGGNGIFELSCAATDEKGLADGTVGTPKNDIIHAKFGDIVKISPKPNKGFGVESVKVLDKAGGNEVAKVDQNNCFVMPELESVTVEVIFTGNNVCAITDGHGTYTINGMEGPTVAGKPGQICVQAVKNSTVQIDLKPGKGYELDKISVVDTKTLKNELKVSVSGNKASFVMPDEDVLISVSYKPIQYKINVLPSEYGTATVLLGGKEVTTCNAGPTINVVCHPDYNAEVEYVRYTDREGNVKDAALSGATTYDIPMPLSDIDIEIKFISKDKHDINVETPGHGSYGLWHEDTNITFTPQLAGGQSCSIKTIPEIFYNLEKITVNGEAIKLNGRYGPHDFTMPNKDANVVITYVPSGDNFCARRQANGTYTINGEPGPETTGDAGQVLMNFKPGETINIVATPQPGYMIDKVTVKDYLGKTDLATPVIEGNNVSFKMPSESAVLDISFKIRMYDIKLNPVTNGRFVCTNAGGDAITNCNFGPEVFISTMPDAAAAVENVVVTDSEGKNIPVTTVTANSSYKFSMPLSDVTVDVKFVSTTVYNFTLDVSPHGKVDSVVSADGTNITSTAKLAGGQTAVITTLPEYGYNLERITVNGTDIAINGEYGPHSFTMPNMDAKIEVVFSPSGQNLFARIDAKGANGSFTINGEAGPTGSGVAKEKFVPMDKDKEVKLVASPQTGYELDKVTVTDVTGKKELVKPVINGNEISFKMPEGTAIVTVSFKLSIYDIKLAPVTNGKVTLSKTSSNAGPSITVDCAPATGYKVGSVKYTDSKGVTTDVTLSGTKYSFSMPASDVTVKVEFLPN